MRIESIGGGHVGGGGGSGWGAIEMAVLCHQYVTQTGTNRMVDQVCRQNQFETRRSLINTPQWPHRP